MRNPPISQRRDIRADARFDALVKKEMQEYQHLISSHNKEMQALRDEVRHCLQKCESVASRNEKELSDLKDRAESHIQILKDRIADHALTIAEQKKTIESLHEKLSGFHEEYASKTDVARFKKEINDHVTNSTMSHIVSFQDSQREFKGLFSSLKDELLKLNREVENKILEAIDKAEDNFSQARMDKEGIERELIRYKKAVFYIEKKIENIYTLIERINKRGELCHKPE